MTRVNYNSLIFKRKVHNMKYLLLMWTEGDASSGNKDDMNAWVSFTKEAKDAGVLVMGDALKPAAESAKLVRPDLSKPETGTEVSKGTFNQSKAQIQGFYIFECKDDDEAIKWTRKMPTYSPVELRPLMEYDLG